MTLACHSLFAKSVLTAMNEWRGVLLDRAGITKRDEGEEAVDEKTLAENRRSAVEAAQNMGARLG